MEELISWDSDAPDGTFCGDTTEGLVNAAFCEDDDTIGWDRTVIWCDTSVEMLRAVISSRPISGSIAAHTVMASIQFWL